MASALFRLNLASSALNYTCSGCTVVRLLPADGVQTHTHRIWPLYLDYS